MKNIFSNKITYVVLAAISIFAVSLKVVAISHSKNNNSNTSSGIIASKDVPSLAPNANIAHTDAITTNEIENRESSEVEFARLGINGDQIGFFSNSYMTATYFVFLDSSMKIANTLTIDNGYFEAPYYRVVKGKKHDWLVVTKIHTEGTGIMEHEDDWFVVDSHGLAKKVLSYLSSGYQVDNPTDTYLWSGQIFNENNLNDSSVDIKITEQKCADVTNDKPPKGINCTDISQTDHYVWDGANVEFVLSNYSGSKDSLFHY